jgi:hypothetical protein
MRARAVRWALVVIGLGAVLGAMAGCSRGDFGLRAAPDAVAMTQGSSSTVAIELPRTGSFEGEITFAVRGAPAGLTVKFEPVKADATCTRATLTMMAAAGLDIRKYSIVVAATSGKRTKETTVGLTVLVAPRFSLQVAPVRLTVAEAETVEVAVSLDATATFTDAVKLTVGGCPAGLIASFVPEAIKPGESSTMSLKVADGASLGSFLLAVRGEGGGLTSTASLTTLALPKERTITYPSEVLETLAEWERIEQVRDWIVAAFLAARETPVAQLGVSLHSQPPLREPALGEVYSWQYGISRWVWVDDDPTDKATGDLYAFLPAGADRQLLGGLADDFRRTTGKTPDCVHYVTYAIEEQESRASFAYRETIPGETLFADAGPFGYREAVVRTKADLERLLGTIDDLVYVSVEGNAVRLGGRDLPGRSPVVSAEDVAVLYQAYQKTDVRTLLAALTSALKRESPRMTSADASTLAADIYNARTKGDAIANKEAVLLCARYGISVDRAVALHDANMGTAGGGIGFSLDPQGAVDFPGLTAALAVDVECPPSVDSLEWWTAVLEVENGQLLPLHQIMESLLVVDTPEARDSYAAIRALLGEYAAQCARYIGGIRGTAVGMTLYYCDLLAKLWVFDYAGSTPRAIGMAPDLELPIGSVYWQEMQEIREGRLWFGVNRAMLGVTEAMLYFAPIAARVFCAATDPSNQGNEVGEVKPREDWRVWFQWWEAHWPEIMAYEPEYYRLNQIVKVSAVVAWLQESGRMSALGFLATEAAARALEFDTWINENRDRLSLKAWLPFTGTSAGGTECLSRICSEWVLAFSGSRGLSGGVSLAKPDELLLAHKPDVFFAAAQRAMRGETSIFTDPNKTQYNFDAADSVYATPLPDVRFRRPELTLLPVEGVATVYERPSPGVLSWESAWDFENDQVLEEQVTITHSGIAVGGSAWMAQQLALGLVGKIELPLDDISAMYFDRPTGDIYIHTQAGWFRATRNPAPKALLRVGSTVAPFQVAVELLLDEPKTKSLTEIALPALRIAIEGWKAGEGGCLVYKVGDTYWVASAVRGVAALPVESSVLDVLLEKVALDKADRDSLVVFVRHLLSKLPVQIERSPLGGFYYLFGVEGVERELLDLDVPPELEQGIRRVLKADLFGLGDDLERGSDAC